MPTEPYRIQQPSTVLTLTFSAKLQLQLGWVGFSFANHPGIIISTRPGSKVFSLERLLGMGRVHMEGKKNFSVKKNVWSYYFLASKISLGQKKFASKKYFVPKNIFHADKSITLTPLALELDTIITCSTHHPPTPPTTTNFSATCRPPRELKLGTDTH